MAQTAASSGAQVALHRKIGIVKQRAPMPRQKWPQMIEAEYAKAIIDMLARSKAGIIEIVNAMPALIASAAVGNTRTDADEGRRAREMVDAARAKMRQTIHPNEIDKLAEKFGQRTANYHKSELAKQVHATFGIDVHYVDRPGARISNFAAASVAHIQSIPERLHDSVSKLVTRGISEGMSHDTLAGHIEEAYATGETDARRIARDQIGKLYGALNADRQQSMGVNRFIWRTAGDERVRDEHEILEGQEFSFDDGGDEEEGLPGEPIQCRCYAEPVLDDILGEADDGEGLPDISPDDQPALPEPGPQQLPSPEENAVELAPLPENIEQTDLEVPEGYVSLPHFEDELGLDAKQMRGILRKLDLPKPPQGWSWPPEEAALIKEKIIEAAGKRIKIAAPAPPPVVVSPPPSSPVAVKPPSPVVHPPHVIPPPPAPVIERPKDEPPPIPKARVRNPRSPKPLNVEPSPGFTSGTAIPPVKKGTFRPPTTAIVLQNVGSNGQVIAGKNSIDRAVQREMRVNSNKLVAQYGLPQKEKGATRQFVVVVQTDKKMAGALASHMSGTSEITLNQTTATRYSAATKFLNNGGDFAKARREASTLTPAPGPAEPSGFRYTQQQAVDNQISALKTMTHETIHAHGPPNGYEGHGVFVEEVTTESAARRITRETLGLHNLEVAPGMRDGSTQGSYGAMIGHTSTSIAAVLQEAGVHQAIVDEAPRMVGDMALRYKSYSVNPFKELATGPEAYQGRNAYLNSRTTSAESLKLMAHCVDFKGEAAKTGMNLSDEQVASMKASLVQKLSAYQDGRKVR